MQAAPKYKPALEKVPLLSQGKSRDMYRLVLANAKGIYASNRLSTHNKVHLSEIHLKGEVLTGLTVFWLTEVLKDLPNHLLYYGTRALSCLPGKTSDHPPDTFLRLLVVKNLKIIPVEFIFRSYLAGSLWKKYVSKGLPNPYGIRIPHGAKLMHHFREPIFTPTEKSEDDEPLNAEEVIKEHPVAYELARNAYIRGSVYLAQKGTALVDSKFEVGIDENGKYHLADEILTPDSSRFSPSDQIREGQEPSWEDKEIARIYAESVWSDGEKNPLMFPAEVCSKLSEVYMKLFHKVTGMELQRFQNTKYRT